MKLLITRISHTCFVILFALTSNLLLLSASAASSITVESAADSVSPDGKCTLREAIVNANQNSDTSSGDCEAGTGTDKIVFNIPSSGVSTIQIGDSLPLITETLTIDGFSQPGASVNTAPSPQPLNAKLRVEIDGSNTSLGQEPCLRFSDAHNSEVRGLVINSCGRDGIEIFRSNNIIITGNYIGTDATGLQKRGNGRDYTGGAIANGIFANSSHGMRIGGSQPGERNIIASNQAGEVFWGNENNFENYSGDNVIQGNYIGVAADGVTPMPSGRVWGIGNSLLFGNSHNDLIGGGTSAEANVIGSSSEFGVSFRDGCSNSKVSGNFIGTDYTGNRLMSHYLGAGHPTGGVHISAVTNGGFNRGSHHITVGGATTGERNIISGNSYSGDFDAPGVWIHDGGHSNTISGNYIGTTTSGMSRLANEGNGIYIENSHNDLIGGTTPAAGNLVSGNENFGIYLGNSSNTKILSNTVGLAKDRTTILDNLNGLYINGGVNSVIGSATAGNVITGNKQGEVNLSGADVPISNTIMRGNKIGVNKNLQPRLNTSTNSTVFIIGDVKESRIGGSELSMINHIGGKPTKTAVSIQKFGSRVPSNNSLIRNIFYGSPYQAIDLLSDDNADWLVDRNSGYTGNDLNDADSGPNNMQNHPKILQVSRVNGTIRITYSFDANNGEATTHNYRLDFYASAADRRHNRSGDPRYYLGSINVAGDVSRSTVSFAIGSTPSTARFISSMATSFNAYTKNLANSSELSPSLMMP